LQVEDAQAPQGAIAEVAIAEGAIAEAGI